MYYYHNITKGQINEADTIDLMDTYDPGDVIYKTESGNALLIKVEDEEINELYKQWEQSDDESEYEEGS